ncbi:hypothetical protein WK78_22070 [Burkholderia cepacia]|uniref:DUF1656 domain-containing protein n=1 Tax=Burkholderia cenocepacia TaxID=95486 RepID=A0ABD4UIT7_9BURK|nr:MULTISPECIES: DUF1656 domain-containing protein [Burkholderia cepacia complex]KVV23140.1 hypothetical protein WK78_22070 [Burkholderia cepacia]MCW3698182.1 DUF1656 domain-containing protein [Burkholderia cenocepacia]MCW3706035.1 DUF1656 domain-containing protein [Burkholderia cenocepacia]MCW3714276.1 DUF1656 domain-containing protein [Burkholderia cenocepacia]MCW3722342.1 DUF1656 domain-containing protein [Burkholderia cenocepacia]
MTADLDILGIFVPPMVAVGIIALVLLSLLRRALTRLHAYDYISHRNLFDVSLYFVIVAGLLFALGGETITPLFHHVT